MSTNTNLVEFDPKSIIAILSNSFSIYYTSYLKKFDIGGGSTQLIYYNRKNILNTVTLPFGSVVLTDMVKQEGLTPVEKSDMIEKYVTEELEKLEWLRRCG